MCDLSRIRNAMGAFRRALCLVLVPALVLLVTAQSTATAAVTAGCRIGYSFNFFNGVGNTWLDANASAHALAAAYGDSYKGEPVRYQIFYNTTQGFLIDAGETFVQRGLELDPSGSLSYGNGLMFWTWLKGKFDPSTTGFSNMQVSQVPGLQALFESLSSTFVATTVAAWSRFLALSPTDENLARHRVNLATQESQGRKLLMLAHSQGNLFVNSAYDYIGPIIGTNMVKVVHVAPASPTLRGKYILSSADAVINALRAANGVNTVADNNIDLPVDAADPLGHGLVPIYLNPALAARAVVNQMVNDNFVALSSPQGPCPMTVTPSSVTNAKAGDTVVMTANLETVPSDDYTRTTYKWSVSGNASGLLLNPVDGSRAASFETTSKTVTYVGSVNALNGTQDTVSATAVYTSRIDPTVTRNFSAPTTATVKFGANTLTLAGRFKVLSWARTDPAAFPGLYQVNAYVIFPRVAGAKSYKVRAFNFNDTAFYGTSYTRNLEGEPLAMYPDWDLSFPANLLPPDVAKVGNEVYISISGSGGDSTTAAAFENRFRGIQVEVDVQL